MSHVNCQEVEQFVLSAIKKYEGTRSDLIPILHDVQHKYHHIPSCAKRVIIEALDILPVEVESVITFYAFFETEPQGETMIHLSDCVPCRLAEAEKIAAALEKHFGIKMGETTKDGKFTIKWTSCIGMCDHAAAMLIDGIPVVDVTPKNVVKKIKEYLKNKSTQIKIEPTNSNDYSFETIQPNMQGILATSDEEIIQTITDSGLRGCGGAGFPTGMKLKFAKAAEGKQKYVVCNADEGEPGTFKDRVIFTKRPDLVFNGMAIAGKAIGATKGILYLRAEYEYLLDKLEAALKEIDFDIQIRFGAGAYVCGEETALIESLEGQRGEPRNRPPFPIQAGYLQEPTCVNNVETFMWIACIMEKGAKWFNQVGTEQSKGYKLFSVSGDCKKPGVYELPMGTTIAEFLKVVGGEDAKALQCGGASGQTIPAAQFDRQIAFEDAPPGGSMIVVGKERDLLEMAEHFMEFFVEESCGQCTPCRIGNGKILDGIKLLRAGKCPVGYLESLISLIETMQQTAKCGLGQTSPNVLQSLLTHFKAELIEKNVEKNVKA